MSLMDASRDSLGSHDVGVAGRSAEPRGAPDNIRVAHTPTSSRRYTILDVPGGPRSVKAALRACAVGQSAVLVVSATTGAQSQTREHILAAKVCGLSPLIVVINDEHGEQDLVDACTFEVRSLLNDHGEGGDDTVVITGSARDVEVGRAVLEALDAAVDVAVDDESPALMRVLFGHPRRSRQRGRGDEAVASGRLITGTLRVGDPVQTVGSRQVILSSAHRPIATAPVSARVERLEIQGQAVDVVGAGEQFGVQLIFDGNAPLVDRFSTLLLGEGHAGPAAAFRARLTLRPTAIGGRHHPLRAGFRCLAWIGCASMVSVIIPIGADDRDVVVEPGATFDAVISFWGHRYWSPGMTVALTGDGGLIASGHIVDAVDPNPYLQRFEVIRGLRHEAWRATRVTRDTQATQDTRAARADVSNG